MASHFYNYTPVQSHMFSGPTRHPIVSYCPTFTTSLAPTMVGYGSGSCQGVRPIAPSFSTPTTPTRSTSGFSSMRVSFMAHPAASYVDAVSPTSGQDVVWYPDSGATHHITNNRGILHLDVVYTCKQSFFMGNGAKVDINHVGTSCFSSGSRTLRLQNLLCVPDVTKNLLSVSQFAADNDVFFGFYSHKCLVKDVQTRVPLLEGKLTPEGLYELRVSPVGSVDESTGLSSFAACSVSVEACATSFPLVLVNCEEKLVDQPGGRESLDQPKCHEWVGVTYGSSPVHVDLLYPELVLDHTSEQSGDPELGPCLKQLQSAEGANHIGSCSTGSPCVDPINKWVDSSLLELGCDQESASEDRGKGLDSDLNFTQRDDGGILKSDLGLPCSSARLECFDSQPDKLCLHEDLVTGSSSLVVNNHPIIMPGKSGIRKPKVYFSGLSRQG
ncbi:hypothetical protein GQ457_08G017670 [Hibiscus cannabinus]